MSKTITFNLPREYRLDPDDICVIHSRSENGGPWEVWGAFDDAVKAMHTCMVLKAYEAGQTTTFLRWPE